MRYMIAIVGLVTAVATAAQDSVRGDVLLIDRLDKTAHVDVPRQGLTMEQVSASFGQPINRVGAVGDPPIARWVYADFTVYFEHQWVIHTVVNRASETETMPENT